VGIKALPVPVFFLALFFFRSQLEYAVSVWNPKFCYLIDNIEKIQKEQQRF